MSRKRPLITAHSGCLDTPPNSIRSIIAGFGAGADIVEVDVRVTKDGIVVLYHDDRVHSLHRDYPFAELTYDELCEVKLDDPLIRLEQVLPYVRDARRMINLDVKELAAVGAMFEIVEHLGMRDAVLVTGCEKAWASEVKTRYRKYPVLLNASKKLYASLEDDYDAFVRTTCEDALEAGCSGINIYHAHCRESLVEAASLRCLPVCVWTVDEREQMKRFLAMGVHSITTHQVHLATELLSR